MKSLILLLLFSLTLVVGCAGKHRNGGVIVDTKGVNMQQYHQDLEECHQYAHQVNTGEKVAKGTVGGAVIGGALGAAVGNSNTAQRGAGTGAILGAADGLSHGEREKQQVVRNCLIGRGYRVLN